MQLIPRLQDDLVESDWDAYARALNHYIEPEKHESYDPYRPSPLQKMMSLAIQMVRAENEAIDAQVLAIPPDDWPLYEIRIRVHADGSETSALALKTDPGFPCECAVCKAAQY
jgi:hypothetical protein